MKGLGRPSENDIYTFLLVPVLSETCLLIKRSKGSFSLLSYVGRMCLLHSALLLAIWQREYKCERRS